MHGTIEQVAALALAGSEIVRVTVNNEEAAAAVPHIVEGLEKRGLRVPIVGDFHYNGHLLLKKYPATAQALAKYRINPGNASIGKKDNDNFQVMVECAVENQKPVRIGVNWGSLDQSLLTRMMDENSRQAQPLPAREVMMEAMVRERAGLGRRRRALRAGPRPDYSLGQGERRARSDRCVYQSCRALRLSAASGADRSGDGSEGADCLDGGLGAAAAGRDWRHDSRELDAQAGRRPDGRSSGRATGFAVAGDSQLHAAGDELPGLRADDEHIFPGAGRADSELSARLDAGVAEASMRAWRS